MTRVMLRNWKHTFYIGQQAQVVNIIAEIRRRRATSRGKASTPGGMI